MKYSGYSALGIFVLITGAVALTLFLVNTGWGKDKIIGIANDYSPVGIKLEGLSLNVFKGRIELRDISVYDAEDVKMGSIGYLGLGVEYKPMFSGQYIVDSLIIADIYLDVSANQLESFKSDKPVEEKAEPDTAKVELDLIVNKFEIRGISAQYKDESSGSEYALRNKSIKASADVKNIIYSLLLKGTEADIKTPQMNKTVENESLDLEFEEDKVFIGETEFLTHGLTLSLGGSVLDIFGVPYFDLKFSADVETEKLLDRMDAFAKDSGVIRIAGSVSGEAEDPAADFTVRHTGGVVYAQEITGLDLKAGYKDKILSLDAGISKSANEKFTVNGAVDLTGVFTDGLISSEPEIDQTSYDLIVTAEKFSLSNIKGMPDTVFDFGLDLKGKGVSPDKIVADVVLNTEISPFDFEKFSLKEEASLFADVSWNKGKFTSVIDINAGRSVYDTYGISSTELSITASDEGTVEINGLRISLDGGEINVSGSSKIFGKDLAVLKDPEFDLNISADSIQTQKFYPDIETLVNFQAEASGRLSDYTAEYNLTVGGFEYSGVIIEGIELKGKADEKIITADHLLVRAGGSEINLSGKMTDYSRFDAVIRTENLSADSLYPALSETLSLKTDISISAGGTFDNPEAEGNIRIRDIDYEAIDISDISLDFTYSGNILSLDIGYDFPVKAKADLNKNTFEASLDINEWDYSHLIPDNSDRYFEGFLNGKINAEGSFGDVPDYYVTADIDSVVFSADKRKIVHGSKFEADLRSDIIELKNIDLILLDDGFFRTGGTIKNGKALDLFTEISLPIKSLSFIVPELSETEGYLKGAVSAGGDITEPVLKGKLTLEKLGMILPVTEQKLYDVNGEIAFSREGVNINEISGRIDNGTLGIGGNISLDGTEIKGMDISIKTTALPFEYPDHLEGLINTDLKFSGTPSKGALRGNVLIVDALYYKDVDLFGGVFKGSGPKTVRTASESDSLPDISLDLTLKSRRTLVMDNNLGFLELKPDLQIKGDISNPLISGRAVIQKDGFIVFQKRTFTVKKGVLDFEPVYGMLPTADIQSQTEVNQHKIFLSISENLSNPKFSLTSVPPESDADILSILLFGRKSSDLSSGGTEVSKEKLIADWLTSAYSEDIAKKTGLDYIEVGVADDFTAKEPSGYGITVGKKISDRLILKYSVSNSGSEMIQKGIADYQLLENVIFSGFQSTDGTFGAETQFRKEFR